jgi:hypothetical protein
VTGRAAARTGLALVALVVAAACADAATPAGAASSASSARAAAPSATPGGTAAASGRTAPARVPATPTPARRPVVLPGWVGPIYPPHAHGYDVSYPQCPGTRVPQGASFSIVGVNSGRAFTVNPCLSTEWRVASGRRATYLNSGYDTGNVPRITADCGIRSQVMTAGGDPRAAYAIGCSEAIFAADAMRAAGATPPVMVWLDVETSNSWDPAQPELNRIALQAEIDVLAASGHLVGLYSTFAEWRGIMGDWSPGGVVADWVAGGTPRTSCGSAGFSGHPVWIAQELATWAGDDSDWTC